MNFLELVKNRYSCKAYDPARGIDEETLVAILEAGRLAPTAKNTQEHRVRVLRSAAALAAVDAHTPCRYGAPVVLAVSYDTRAVYTYPDSTRTSGDEDASIVATHLMLAAAACGVDSCWVNRFPPDALRDALGIPAYETLVLLLDLGYAAEGAGPLPNHFSRKPLGETVTYL